MPNSLAISLCWSITSTVLADETVPYNRWDHWRSEWQHPALPTGFIYCHWKSSNWTKFWFNSYFSSHILNSRKNECSLTSCNCSRTCSVCIVSCVYRVCVWTYSYSEEEISRKVSVYRQMLMDNLETSANSSTDGGGGGGVVEKDEIGRPMYVMT